MKTKELNALHSDKCTIEAVDASLGRGLETRIVVCFSLTRGEFDAMKNILTHKDAATTAVRRDLIAYFNNANELAED